MREVGWRGRQGSNLSPPFLFDLIPGTVPIMENKFYECGCCGCYHPVNWDGDCRDDENRFAADELDAKFGGSQFWVEVDQPEGTSDPKRYLPGGIKSRNGNKI